MRNKDEEGKIRGSGFRLVKIIKLNIESRSYEPAERCINSAVCSNYVARANDLDDMHILPTFERISGVAC